LKAKELKARFATLVLAGLAVLAAVANAQQPSAAGLWQKLDEDTHQPVIWFLLVDRGGLYEGYAVRMFPRPGEDPNPVCTRCTDDRKGMPLLGLPMIRGMKRVGLRYEDGTVLDPRDGKVYSAVMRLDPAQGTLTLHGYVGIELFGKDDVWNRVPDSGFKDIDPALLAKLAPERAQGQSQKGKAKSPQR
jgi:hypothetical protein